MKILVLGADGMLGHELISTLRGRHEVAGTVRRSAEHYRHHLSHMPDRLFCGVDSREFASVQRVISEFAPDAVVNAIGIVKQRSESKDAIESILVNSLLPHRLAEVCVRSRVRLVHLSTDCVFDGGRGMYRDDDLHDARDLYGRSKSMGEVEGAGVLTLRTSIIGLELARKASLVEWFLAQTGDIRGFTRAIYSGFITSEMARIIEALLSLPEAASGVYNVSSEPIDKFTLLEMLNARLGRPVRIRPDDTFRCDRSLDSSRFRTAFGYEPPTWAQMLDELAGQVRERAGSGS